MPCASFSMLDGQALKMMHAHGIEKLLLKTQVSLTSFLQSEVKIIHIKVQDQDGQNNNIIMTYDFLYYAAISNG